MRSYWILIDWCYISNIQEIFSLDINSVEGRIIATKVREVLFLYLSTLLVYPENYSVTELCY